ncbi:unannotated protein [freshwater metagenome]|uniref:Unannotated protein n=1 Tax=freshwater metagenome TaxID=449393 RepID=A0A6J7LF29_9ZZZZ
MTTAGPMSRWAGTWLTSSRSLPVIQWFGASKWVPVCSPVWKLFQYQAGPFSSYSLMSSSWKVAVWPNSGGKPRIGVPEWRGDVRSMTSTEPSTRAAAKPERSAMCSSFHRV